MKQKQMKRKDEKTKKKFNREKNKQKIVNKKIKKY